MIRLLPSPPAVGHHLLARSWGLAVLRALLPSFIADRIYPEQKPAWRVHPTSYLDGLRGIASFIVFICHFTEIGFRSLTDYYGADPEKANGILQLPYVRLIFSGRPMVHIFFVISGFVLSYKPVKSIHARDLAKCFSVLASSTFRRAFRLFGPCLASTFIVLLLVQAGCIGSPKETFAAQFWDWKDAVHHQITWPWAWDKELRPRYDIHLWTIPIEFAHSMLLFIVILMLSHVRRTVRQSMVFAIMIYCLTCGKWAGFEFLTGMFLAELHILKAAAHQQQQQQLAKGWETFSPELLEVGPLTTATTMTTKDKCGAAARSSSALRNGLCLAAFAAGFFVAGWPNRGAENSAGIRVLLGLTPAPFDTLDGDDQSAQKFWFALCAGFIAWSCGEMRPVKRFLEAGPAQYLGRISYAIYIMHGPVIDLWLGRVAGEPYRPAQGQPDTPDFQPERLARGMKGRFGADTPAQLELSWLFSLCVIGPLVVWAADLFWRLVDEPIVRWGRKLELACLDDAEVSRS